jgi:hypothetical protein
MTRAYRSVGGFAALEAVVGALILTAVVLTLSATFLRTQQDAHNVKRLNQSRALADMVFEHYTANASTANIRALDQDTPVSPAQFFGTGTDNLGYDKYLLQTRAECTTHQLLCDIHVTVTWTGGTATRSQEYVRTFTTVNAPASGGTVHVWIKEPCAETNPTNIKKICPPLTGFEVRASSSVLPNHKNIFGTSEVVAFTNEEGLAILRNVPTGPGLTVTARKPGSHIAQSVSFDQGYYYEPAGTAVSRASFIVDVSSDGPTDLIIQDFRPLGKISGVLTNVSGGPVSNMIVSLSGTASTGRGLRFNPRWSVLTNSSGEYTFNNVYPGAYSVIAAGDPGSHPDVTPQDGSIFRWGYSNPSPYSVTLPAPVGMTQTSATQNVSVKRLGWIKVTVLRLDGTTAWNATIRTRLPRTLFRQSAPVDVMGNTSWMSANPNGGIVHLFNVIDTDNTRLTFTGNTWPSVFGGGTTVDQGMFLNLAADCDTDQENQITIRASQTFYLLANTVRSPSGTLIRSWQLSPRFIHYPEGTVTGQTNSVTSMWGAGYAFNPSRSTSNGVNVPIFWNYLNSHRTTASATGRVLDELTEEPLENINVSFYADSNALVSTTDSDGRFSLNGGNLFVTGYSSASFACSGSTCTPPGASGSLVIDTMTVTVDFEIPYSGPYEFTLKPRVPMSMNGTLSDVELRVALTKYRVSGQVTDSATGAGVAGLLVCDKSTNYFGSPTRLIPNVPCVTTASDGSYSLMAAVVGRRRLNDGTREGGTVGVYVPESRGALNGKAYAGSVSSDIAVPVSSPDPTTGVFQNFALTSSEGSL